MKTILVPTDFSKIARNAVEYAAEFALHSKSKLVLFHVYHIPVVSSEAPVVLPMWEEIESDCMDALVKIKSSLKRKFGKELVVECMSQMGFAVDEIIKEYTEDNNIELIIMGMNGAGYIEEKVMGSNATELIKRSKCPVLIINENIKFSPLKKVVFAFDYKAIPGKSIMEFLKKITALFKSDLSVVNVVKEEKKLPSVKKSAAGVTLDNLLEGINHTFSFIENEDTIAGINEFVKKEKSDLLVFISRKHNLLNSLLHESNTKRMAFHTKIPLLALPE